MISNIINNKSNFVVITYWWGRNKKNLNTQRPCPSEKSNYLYKEPLTYDIMIDRWINSCIKNNCNYMAIEYPEFSKRKYYQKGINFKPYFIQKALKSCFPRGVLYIDGDMIIKKYPYIFDLKHIDFMARSWNIDWREHNVNEIICFDPFVFETSGGTMFFANSQCSYELLQTWIEWIKKMPGKADDRILSLAFNVQKKLLQTKIVQLPIEYLWLTMDYEHIKLKPIIEHPECLTEDDQDAIKTNRIPKKYNELVQNKVNCRKRMFIFFEYIFFPRKSCIKSIKNYIDTLSKKNTLVIPYNEKYGIWNKVADYNFSIMKTLQSIDRSDNQVILSTKKRNISNEHVIKKKFLFQYILAYLYKGVNVLYLPKTSPVENLDLFSKDDICKGEFILRNINKKKSRYIHDYFLKIDKHFPVYFSSKSLPLKHLITISKCFTQLENHFNLSFDFISRISCIWI